MPVPRQRHTKSKRNRQRSHQALKVLNLSKCPQCGQTILAHRVCKNCGKYQGREVVDVLKKLSKKEQKNRRRELEEQEEQAQREKETEERGS